MSINDRTVILLLYTLVSYSSSLLFYHGSSSIAVLIRVSQFVTIELVFPHFQITTDTGWVFAGCCEYNMVYYTRWMPMVTRINLFGRGLHVQQ